METYNALSFEEWVYSRASPALDGVGDKNKDVVGMGLGCWKWKENNNTWATTAESADQRICYLMNRSKDFAPELDMFTIRQNESSHDPDYGDWPEPFWIAPLQKWMRGGGCDTRLPTRTVCPTATMDTMDRLPDSHGRPPRQLDCRRRHPPLLCVVCQT